MRRTPSPAVSSLAAIQNSNNGDLNLLDAATTTAPTKQFRLTWNYTHSPTLLNNLNYRLHPR